MFASRMDAWQLFRDTYLGRGDDFDPQPVETRKYTLPGELQFRLEQYRKPPGSDWEDNAFLVYSNREEANTGIHIYVYVSSAWPHEQLNGNTNECFDLMQLYYPVSGLRNVADSANGSDALTALLRFDRPDHFIKPVILCHKKMQVATALQHPPSGESHKIMHLTAHAQMLLLHSLEALELAGEETFTFCRFKPDALDHEKVEQAKEILLQRLGDPITIADLSRKVAMNECYLKRQFKAMTGFTIFEFYQKERMQYARRLLLDQGLSVTEVSAILGYSSISHFSTAFKRHTGIKPCELLIR